MNYLKLYFSRNYLPRWMILFFDLTVSFLAWIFAYLLRFNFDVPMTLENFNILHSFVVVPVLLLCFYESKSYAGILRHSTAKDMVRIILAVTCAGIILAILSYTARYVKAPALFVIPFSVIIIFTFLVSTVLSMSRILVKILFEHLRIKNTRSKNVMIYGAGLRGQSTYNAIITDNSVLSHVLGFIDDNPSLQGKYVMGIPIYSSKKAFPQVVTENRIAEIILAIDNSHISRKRKQEIANLCINTNIQLKEVPPINSWINGQLHAKEIRPIQIEDLLGRSSIQLDYEKIGLGLKNASVLITGAAGSIGSEIVRQLVKYDVKQLIMLDKAESDLYNLQQEIKCPKLKKECKFIVGDVTNENTLRGIFMKYTPTIVFNAAAYKHVPLMEEFPAEAIRVNVGGTKLLANLSVEFEVDKFVFISTDKAVNPTNVMGASKRISEIYIQALAQTNSTKTKFITTRFGNVLGSNGSVVPLFKKQIEKGGPVTITHKDITRFFMTIPEACQLVLEAGFMGEGGEIFVFDMGEPVKIYDLAKKMISLSGFVPHRDIKIEITGLRPGEKLYEELLSKEETLLSHTYNEKIMIGKNEQYDFGTINKKINYLLDGVDRLRKRQLVKLMMNIVPEFVSMNSYYSDLENESVLMEQLNMFNRKVREIGKIEPKSKNGHKRTIIPLAEKLKEEEAM